MRSHTFAVSTIADLNKANRRDWKFQSGLFEELMKDARIAEEAAASVAANSREIPISLQMSFEKAASEAQAVVKRRNCQPSGNPRLDGCRKGGMASRTDRLQGMILSIVGWDRCIAETPLKYALGKVPNVTIDKEPDPIEKVRLIHYIDWNGTPRTSPLSGLKHRLRNARRAILLGAKPKSLRDLYLVSASSSRRLETNARS